VSDDDESRFFRVKGQLPNWIHLGAPTGENIEIAVQKNGFLKVFVYTNVPDAPVVQLEEGQNNSALPEGQKNFYKRILIRSRQGGVA